MKLPVWFHRLGSPPSFYRIAGKAIPWLLIPTLLLTIYGLYGGLVLAPADYQQSDAFRIIYIHVPAAWMSMAGYALMAVSAFIALVWRMKLAELMVQTAAPIGAAFTVITLATGSIWGKPMWGTWWDWDPRLTSELVLLFLYLGVIALAQDFEDKRAGRRAACFLALIWRIKLCEILAMACAPIGAAFTLITLATGSIWGKPMWGTWWDWDPRLTTQLVLLFLYLGVTGLYHAIDDRRAAARAAGLLAIVGVALLPVIRYSVVWWNSLHQGQTIRLLGESSMDPSMILPLWIMVFATKFWFLGSLLSRARADNLRREAGKDWVAKLAQVKP